MKRFFESIGADHLQCFDLVERLFLNKSWMLFPSSPGSGFLFSYLKCWSGLGWLSLITCWLLADADNEIIFSRLILFTRNSYLKHNSDININSILSFRYYSNCRQGRPANITIFELDYLIFSSRLFISIIGPQSAAQARGVATTGWGSKQNNSNCCSPVFVSISLFIQTTTDYRLHSSLHYKLDLFNVQLQNIFCFTTNVVPTPKYFLVVINIHVAGK